MQPLEKGDVVDIIAPASGCSEDEYNKAIEFVRNFGLKPRFRKFTEVIEEGLCANNIEFRFQHLIEALESDSKAVWCLKGGYGSQKLLAKLDQLQKPSAQKFFIGFSDITILLNYFADRWGWVSLHGPMPAQVDSVSEDTWQRLAEIVFGKKNIVSFAASPLNEAAKLDSRIVGKFMGGCLSLMQALIGTPQMPNLEGAVLLLEDDRFETPRRVDRILDQMQRAGVFYDVRAVVLGNFLESSENGLEEDGELREVLQSLADYLDDQGVPLIQNIHLGHAYNMLTVPIGAEAEVKLGDKPKVVIRA